MRRTVEQLEDVYFNTLDEAIKEFFEILEESEHNIVEESVICTAFTIAVTVETLLEIDSHNHKKILSICNLDFYKEIERVVTGAKSSLAPHQFLIEASRD